MNIINDLNQWRSLRHQLSADKTIGFVPTMGNLHQGHASLIQKAQTINTYTVVSIFVNPTQFNQLNDYQHYPRTLHQDYVLLNELAVDYCLVPNEESLYPQGYRYQVEEKQLSRYMEGEKRPGHFNGMLTIVLKLLQLVRPHHLYVGEKDYQQYQLIEAMVRDFFIPTIVVPCPIIRESDGLPFSSRNQRLTSKQRELASQFAAIFHQRLSDEETHHQLTSLGITVDYLAHHQQRRFIAVQIGDVRLLDNDSFEKKRDSNE